MHSRQHTPSVTLSLKVTSPARFSSRVDRITQRSSVRISRHRLTPERIRRKDEDQLEAERQAALEARRERFREIYTALGIGVVVNKDRSLEIHWSGGCSRWHRGTFGCCTARAPRLTSGIEIEDRC